jgi:hypothetical protein
MLALARGRTQPAFKLIIKDLVVLLMSTRTKAGRPATRRFSKEMR